MKRFILRASIVLLTLGSITACTSNNSNKTENKEGVEYTSNYVCPMHCEGSGSDTAGLCPTCGMDYVKNEQL